MSSDRRVLIPLLQFKVPATGETVWRSKHHHYHLPLSVSKTEPKSWSYCSSCKMWKCGQKQIQDKTTVRSFALVVVTRIKQSVYLRKHTTYRSTSKTHRHGPYSSLIGWNFELIRPEPGCTQRCLFLPILTVKNSCELSATGQHAKLARCQVSGHDCTLPLQPRHRILSTLQTPALCVHSPLHHGS